MKISVIMPVCACPDPADFEGQPHPHLRACLDSIMNAGHEDVEILIGADGVLPKIKAAIAQWSTGRGRAHASIRYFEYPFSGSWGNRQRNILLQEASGDLVCFQDQDDEFFPGALAAVRGVALVNPGRPLIFRNAIFQTGNNLTPRTIPWVVWMKEGELAKGQIDGHMIVVPNVKHMLGVWKEDAYEGDWHFVTETLQRYAAEGVLPCWRGEFISITRPWARAQ